jgi:signal transduction histidine kinase
VRRWRRAAGGLGPRIVAALVATSAVTLVVAGAAELTPLEDRVRADQLDSLARTAQAGAGAFAELDLARLGDPGLPRAMRVLRSRTRARIVLLDAALRPISDTDPDAGGRFRDAATALRTGRTVRGVSGSGDDATAMVAVPLRADGRVYVIALRRSLSQAGAVIRVVRRALAAAALAGLAAALLLGTLLATRLVRRLRRLRDAALVIAEVGAEAEFEAERGADEVADLSEALAAMHLRVRRQEDARRAFVATASHELRTPLASLSVLLELLDEDLRDAPPGLDAARARVGRARAQSHRLTQLAADLLDLSRLDAQVELRREPLELVELARAVRAEFSPGGPDAEPALRLAGADECWALGDPGAVARILRILVDNALRFTPPGTEVRLATGVAGADVALTVADDGPGVPADERDRIFERFQRGTATAEESGFGLGLAIGRELARRMGGDLRLDAAGAGAAFTLVLPAAATGDEEPSAAVASAPAQRG